MDRIEECITKVEQTGAAFARAIVAEMKLEDDRPIVKQRAVLRIVGTENPLTGKPHSASSAEAVVETDTEYYDYRGTQRAAVVKKITAGAQYEAAKLRARLAMMAALEGAA